MSSLDVNALADVLSKTSVDSCSSLSFSSKGLWLDDFSSAKEVIHLIESCDNLEVLELKGNTLGVGASEFIGKALENKTKLKRLLWSDLFTGRSKAEIPLALVNLCKGVMVANVKLVELDLSDNAFGPNGMMGLTDFLKSSCCFSLQTLKLNNNGLGITGGKMLAESMQKCYEDGCKIGQPLQLKVFVSGRGRLENEGAEALANVFMMIRSLEEVHMPQNGINHAGISALAKAFSVNQNLRILNLSDNTFTEKGSHSMAKAIEDLNNLEEINFEDCLIRTEGAIAIANALEKGHNKLKILRLSGNEIEFGGAITVVQVVKNKPTLFTLELKDNEFDTRGIKSIRKLLSEANAEHVLGCFSDEDEDNSEEEENSDNEQGHNKENSYEFLEVNDKESTYDKGIEACQVDGYSDVDVPLDPQLKNVIEELIKHPSYTKLKNIFDEDPEAMSNYLSATAKKAEGAVLSLMRIAQLCTESKSASNDIVFRYADEFCEKLLKEDSNFLVTGMLFSLGLIKGENKGVRLPEDKRGPLHLLRHIVCQDYFSKPNKQTVCLILHRFKNLLGDSEELGESIAKELMDAGYNCL